MSLSARQIDQFAKLRLDAEENHETEAIPSESSVSDLTKCDGSMTSEGENEKDQKIYNLILVVNRKIKLI